MTRFRPSLPLFASLGLCRALAIDSPAWEEIDFREPLPAHCLAAQGAAVLAGDAEGLRESRDGGTTWKAIASLPGSGAVHALHAADGLLLAVRSGAIYRSADSGLTWTPSEGKASADPPYRFQRSGDSLFLLGSRFPPHPRMLSLDQGRNWTGFSPWEWDPEPVLAEAEPGSLFRLGTDGLSQSTGGGGAWIPSHWDAARGNIASLAGAQGNLYVTTENGMLLRRGARAGEWTVLAAASRPAVPLDLAASGRSLCAYTAMGVSCSQDGGGRFSFLLAEPFSPAGDLAVDGERLYLIRRRDYRLQVLSHTLASAGPWGTIIDTSLSHEIRLAARTGLLLTLDGFPSASIRLSRDQGASFARLAFPPATGVWIMTAALGRRIWAIANSDYHARPLPYSVFRNLYLSGDSGRTYRALSPFPARLIAIGATDSSLFGLDSAGSLHEYRIRDSAWHDLPAPGGAAASALAASDSVLYAFAGGKLWRRNLYDTPAAIRPMRGGPGRNRSARRGAAEFAKAGGGRKWNALGKDAGSRP